MNNFSFSKGKGFLSLFFFLLFATSLVSAAVNIGSTNSGGVSIIQPISTVDYNLTNTNSSNFWDDLDAPLAAWTAVFNSSYALFSYNQTNLTWAFNQSNIQYNFNQSNIQFNFNQSNILYNYNQSIQNLNFTFGQNLTAYTCGGTDKVTGIRGNGTMICGADAGGTDTNSISN